MCLRRDVSVAKITPEVLTDFPGFRKLPEIKIKDNDEYLDLELCDCVPINIYLVLDGFKYMRLFLYKSPILPIVFDTGKIGDL